MADALVRAHSPVEFFKEQVEAACERQRLAAQPLTAHYVVTLLADLTHLSSTPAGEAVTSGELGLRLLRALDSGGSRQRSGLREVGDASLLLCGYFADSLRRRLVDVDYYMSLGGYAYGSLAANDDALAPIFAELSRKFEAYADVLAEVSARTHLTNDSDVLRLYEKWLRTGSRHAGQLLAERGIVPVQAVSVRPQ